MFLKNIKYFSSLIVFTQCFWWFWKTLYPREIPIDKCLSWKKIILNGNAKVYNSLKTMTLKLTKNGSSFEFAYLFSTNGRSWKFCEGFRVRQTPEEGRKTYWRKRWGNNNKDKDNSPKTLVVYLIPNPRYISVYTEYMIRKNYLLVIFLKPEVICYQTFKRFQVLLFNFNNSTSAICLHTVEC